MVAAGLTCGCQQSLPPTKKQPPAVAEKGSAPAADPALPAVALASSQTSGVPPRPEFPATASTDEAQAAAAVRDSCFDAAEGLVAAAIRDPVGWSILGAVHQHYGNDKVACQLWNQCLELDDQVAEAYRQLGDVANNAGDLAEAERQYRLALGADPSAVPVVGRLAENLLLQQDFAAAAELLEAFLPAWPRSEEAWCMLGKTRLQQGDAAAARAAYEKALEIDPQSRTAHQGMGLTLQRLGETETARAHLEKVRRLQSSREAAYRDERIVEADRAGPMIWGATVNHLIGNAYARLGDATRAALGWRTAIELDPDDHESRESLATLYARTGRTREAFRLRQQWCSREPANPAAWFGMAQLALNQGLTDEAVEGLRKVVEIAPERAEGYALLARALSNKDALEALEMARRAVDIDPTAPHYYILADMLVRSGDVNQALAALEQAMVIDPSDQRYRDTHSRLKSMP